MNAICIRYRATRAPTINCQNAFLHRYWSHPGYWPRANSPAGERALLRWFGSQLTCDHPQAQNPENKVFGTARSIERSAHLTKLAQEAPAKNVHVLQADIVDAQSLKVRLSCACGLSSMLIVELR